MAPRKKRVLAPVRKFSSTTVNAAIGGSSNPAYPSGANAMVLAGKGGYTKLPNGKLIRGTYLTANLSPYMTGERPTPFSYNGKRIGTAGAQGWTSTLGKGGKGKGGGKKGGKGKKGGGGAAAEESPLFAPAGSYAEADIATTANIRAQGKAYALGAAGGLSARGQTGTPKKGKEEETATKKKGKRAKGMKRGKGGGRPKPGTHINKQGRIVKNSGKKKR
jgi:hypothetical protein